MKRPEEVIVEFTIQWVEKAEADFNTADYLCTAGSSYAHAAAFHAQQAAEKYLKAYLVSCQVEFKKTHDLAALLKLASTVDEELSVILTEAEALTPYGVEYRYPGDYPQVTPDIAKEALRIASQVRDEIRNRLPRAVLMKEVP
jgi:HEPN domain-containing protein